MRPALLDLFSGIGGFSLGLRPVFKTVSYCEKDPDCQRVLEKHMASGTLDKAPIWDDVCTIPLEVIRKLRPYAISGGFPCQDLSIAGAKSLGLSGARSGLFREIVRIASGLPSVSLIFLENSPMIKNHGLEEEVVPALRGAGFPHIRWCYVGCADLGGRHRRRRWFCVASRQEGRLALIRGLETETDRILALQFALWQKDRVKRVLKKREGHRGLLKRLKMLGNSVIPAVALYAFTQLINSQYFGEVDVPRLLMPQIPYVKLKDGTRYRFWSTPVASFWTRCSIEHPRSKAMLVNQILHEVETMKYLPRGTALQDVEINPQFIEWLMGYPSDWTLVQTK